MTYYHDNQRLPEGGYEEADDIVGSNGGGTSAAAQPPAAAAAAADVVVERPPPPEEGGGPLRSPLPSPFFRFIPMGMRNDLSARAPHYASDWGRPQSVVTVVNASFFAFVAQLVPSLIFAELMSHKTSGNIGVAETLLSSGVIGSIYAVIGGQPLTLLGITGPVAMLLGTSYNVASTLGCDAWPFFWWTCAWAAAMHLVTAAMHLVTAASGLVDLVWKIGPFTTQVFEFFIASSFVYESVREFVGPLRLGDASYEGDRTPAYAGLVVSMLAFVSCWRLHFAETWTLFSGGIRSFLTSYNMAITIILVTALSFLPGVNVDGIERVDVVAPWNWQPSVNKAGETRGWIINPIDGIGVRGIFAALFPAFMLYLLFFIDHNISSILTQAPKYNLKKPPAYHWDFFCLGLTILPCAILGLPPGSGLIPQAPLHTRALATREVIEQNGVKHEVTIHVEEQRWSALGQSCMMFVALSLFTVISWIPKGALSGVYLYLGVGAMHTNEIFRHITLSFVYADKRPRIPIVVNVKWATVQKYTLIQVCCAAAIFGVAQSGTFGYVFPALVAALVPIRSCFVSRCFSEEDLKYLDPIGETDEEAHDERARYLERRLDSIDEIEIITPGFSDFHADGIKRDMEAKKIRDITEQDAVDLADGTKISVVSTLTRRHGAATDE